MNDSKTGDKHPADTLLEKIRNAVEQSDFTSAAALIQEYKENGSYHEELAILEGEVLISTGKPGEAVSCIEKGLSFNSASYELYFMLGEAYELLSRTACAELCYRYSIFQCHKEEDLPFLKENLERFTKAFGSPLPKLAVILKASADVVWLRLCLQLISLYSMPGSFELIFLEMNASDEVRKLLKEQNFAKIISCSDLTEESLYNTGIEAAEPQSDILIIENGGLPLEHTFFTLQASLYQADEPKAAGSISNAADCALYLKKACPTIEDAMEYAHRYNIPECGAPLRVMDLPGPIYLIKRSAIKSIGWFDSGYTLAPYQRKDLFFRMIRQNGTVLLCTNSFSAVTVEQHFPWNAENSNRFYEKWKVNLNYSCHARYDLIQLIHDAPGSILHVLEVGCACGATLLEIERRYPGSYLYGIELDEGPAAVARHFASISNEDIEHTTLSYPEQFFDYIIFGDVLEHLRDPKKVLETVKKYLKPDGSILASIPNVMHISVMKPLLNGFWTYEDAGILDKTHLKFFTCQEIIRLFQNSGYRIDTMLATTIGISEEDQDLISRLAKIQNVPESWFQAYQYLAAAKKQEDA